MTEVGKATKKELDITTLQVKNCPQSVKDFLVYLQKRDGYSTLAEALIAAVTPARVAFEAEKNAPATLFLRAVEEATMIINNAAKDFVNAVEADNKAYADRITALQKEYEKSMWLELAKKDAEFETKIDAKRKEVLESQARIEKALNMIGTTVENMAVQKNIDNK